MKLTSSLICGALLAASQPAQATIDIVFDYSRDTGFFTGVNSSRQTLLNDAASVFETRFGDKAVGHYLVGKRSFQRELL